MNNTVVLHVGPATVVVVKADGTHVIINRTRKIR